jgi:hypothetical protein
MHNALYQLGKIISIENAFERAQRYREWAKAFVAVYKGSVALDEYTLDHANSEARAHLIRHAQEQILYGFAREKIPIQLSHEHLDAGLGRALKLSAEVYVLTEHPDAENKTPKEDPRSR